MTWSGSRFPCDGGIADLLAETEHPGRRFDPVIRASIDRIARCIHIASEVDHRLDRSGVCLLAAGEPFQHP